jgi:hypothetical protein
LLASRLMTSSSSTTPTLLLLARAAGLALLLLARAAGLALPAKLSREPTTAKRYARGSGLPLQAFLVCATGLSASTIVLHMQANCWRQS